MLIYRQNLAARGTPRPHSTPDNQDDLPYQRPRKRNRLGRPPKAAPKREWDYVAPILIEVERWLKRTGIAPTQFGKLSVGDPNLVFDLRAGRDPSSKTTARIRAFMQREA